MKDIVFFNNFPYMTSIGMLSEQVWFALKKGLGCQFDGPFFFSGNRKRVSSVRVTQYKGL